MSKYSMGTPSTPVTPSHVWLSNEKRRSPGPDTVTAGGMQDTAVLLSTVAGKMT